VDPDFMTGGRNISSEPRRSGDHASEHEEGRPHVAVGQHLRELGR
jgi:hypothetical protein